MSIKARIGELGLVLPELTAPKGNYVPWKISRGFCYISGQLPPLGSADAPSPYCGIVGDTVTLDVAVEAARLCGLMIIAQVQQALDGDLDRIAGIVRLGGFVASTATFNAQPRVINGASDLMVEVFGSSGRHTRAAVGVSSLPLGACVEVDAVIELVD